MNEFGDPASEVRSGIINVILNFLKFTLAIKCLLKRIYEMHILSCY